MPAVEIPHAQVLAIRRRGSSPQPTAKAVPLYRLRARFANFV